MQMSTRIFKNLKSTTETKLLLEGKIDKMALKSAYDYRVYDEGSLEEAFSELKARLSTNESTRSLILKSIR